MSLFDPKNLYDPTVSQWKHQKAMLDQLKQQQYYQAMPNYWGMAQAQNPFGGGLLGGGGGQFGFGPGAILQRQGLGHAKPTSLMLPEETCIHALVGWRRWSVTMFGETLMSNNNIAWTPYQMLSAQCLNGSCRGIECGCGIYAYKERKQAEKGDNAPSTVTHIWGEVWLWGRVIEHESGYRAQFAYPKALVNTGGIAQRMAVVYGIKTIE